MDTKSHGYTVVRLDRDPSKEWHRISTSDETPKTETSDMAFEHKSTGTIISLNSVCGQTRETSLEDLSKYLLLGLNTRGPIESKDIQVDGVEARASTVEAAMSERKPSGGHMQEYPVRLRAVVMRKGTCTFDLMYIARPEAFDAHLPDFERFLKGFHAE